MGLTDGHVISAQAQLAQALADVIEADPRVRRCLRLGFADDGGAQIVVELQPGPDAIAVEVIARELEFAAGIAVQKLPWVRVQIG